MQTIWNQHLLKNRKYASIYLFHFISFSYLSLKLTIIIFFFYFICFMNHSAIDIAYSRHQYGKIQLSKLLPVVAFWLRVLLVAFSQRLQHAAMLWTPEKEVLNQGDNVQPKMRVDTVQLSNKTTFVHPPCGTLWLDICTLSTGRFHNKEAWSEILDRCRTFDHKEGHPPVISHILWSCCCVLPPAFYIHLGWENHQVFSHSSRLQFDSCYLTHIASIFHCFIKNDSDKWYYLWY